MKAWLYLSQREDALSYAEVRAALAAADIEYAELPKPLDGPGILFFEEATPALCELLRETTRNGRERVISVAVSRDALTRHAWRILQAGASDLLLWRSNSTARSIRDRLEHWRLIDDLITAPVVREQLVGRSPQWIAVLRQIAGIAVASDAPVLLMGESGTGKELAARVIHALGSAASERPLVPLVLLDCTTVVPELSGSEFFGHERGAFTGAVNSRDGAFALANGSTLFLDEIGELPLRLQAELLRVVQEHTYKRIGSNQWHRTDFRLVCATNRDLLEEQAHGRFRRDLFYRIAGCTCVLPPLRERRDDILVLVDHFIRELRPDHAPLEIEEPVRMWLVSREYPGNIRDLRQFVARILMRHVGQGPITAGDVPETERPRGETAFDWTSGAFEQSIRAAVAAGTGLRNIGRAAEDLAVRVALEVANGSVTRAAETLLVTPRALQLRRAVTRMPPMSTTAPLEGSGASGQ